MARTTASGSTTCAAWVAISAKTTSPGAMVHAAFMAALADGYADVVSSTDLAEGCPASLGSELPAHVVEDQAGLGRGELA